MLIGVAVAVPGLYSEPGEGVAMSLQACAPK